jgi:hypothetical protein
VLSQERERERAERERKRLERETNAENGDAMDVDGEEEEDLPSCMTSGFGYPSASV